MKKRPDQQNNPYCGDLIVGFKRVVAVGDAHAGHRAGIAPPAFQSAIVGDEYYRIQVELWNFYATVIQLLKPIDILIHNGDAIDGPGSRSGGTEWKYSQARAQIQSSETRRRSP